MLRLALVAAIVALLPTTAHAATLEAESFSHDASARITTPRTASNGQALAFTANGTATLTANVPATSRVRVRARGGMFCGAWPHMVVSVGGAVVLEATVAQYGWGAYTGAVDLPAGPHDFALAFDNADFVDCPRILRVDVVSTEDAPQQAWRAFSDLSIWNQPVGSNTQPNPWPGSFTSYNPGLLLGGGPAGSSSHDHDYAKPHFYAQPGDPCVPVTETEPSWVSVASGVKVPACIELPAGARWAAGSDGHMLIVSSDRRWATQCWRVTRADAGGIRATDCSTWGLTGDGSGPKQGSGVQNCCGSAGGRGSGTPIITTTLTPEDALGGVNHALGLTVPSVASSYIYPPASKSDGDGGPLRYGMRFVLRPDFPETGSVGRVNVIRGLKRYGAFLVDQGASFEIDTTGDYRPGEAALWAQAGISRTALNDIRPTDLRYAP